VPVVAAALGATLVVLAVLVAVVLVLLAGMRRLLETQTRAAAVAVP
jgi:hypothetical protein